MALASDNSKADLKGRLIVTAHDEGIFIRNSLDSLRNDVSLLGLELQVEFFLDMATPLTKSLIADSGISHRHLDFGDVAKVRNLALDTLTRGVSMIGFLDGDDCLEAGWIAKVFRECVKQPPGTVFVPSRRVLFWSNSPIRLSFVQPDSSSIPRKLLVSLQRATNLWASALFVYEPQKIVRYRSTDSLHLYEDWWFINDSLAGFRDIKSVEGSLFYFQRKGRRKRQNSAEKRQPLLSPRGKPSFRKRLIGLVALIFTFRPIESLVLTTQALFSSKILGSGNGQGRKAQ